DPAPIEMVETFVNLRPRDEWPRRVMPFEDALWQARQVLRRLEDQGYALHATQESDRDNLVNEVAMNALDRFDKSMRERALLRFHDFNRELAGVLTRFAVTNTIERLQKARRLQVMEGMNEDGEIDRLTAGLTARFAVSRSE